MLSFFSIDLFLLSHSFETALCVTNEVLPKICRPWCLWICPSQMRKPPSRWLSMCRYTPEGYAAFKKQTPLTMPKLPAQTWFQALLPFLLTLVLPKLRPP